jgi:hypothetical protein
MSERADGAHRFEGSIKDVDEKTRRDRVGMDGSNGMAGIWRWKRLRGGMEGEKRLGEKRTGMAGVFFWG